MSFYRESVATIDEVVDEVVICKSCGLINKGGLKSCRKCGTALDNNDEYFDEENLKKFKVH